MFNYAAIDKTPTVLQVRAIIKYMEDETETKYNFSHMLNLNRIKPNKILLDLNDAHSGTTYEITFNKSNDIVTFVKTGSWLS